MDLFVFSVSFFNISLMILLLAVNREEYLGRMGPKLGLLFDCATFIAVWIAFFLVVKIIGEINVYL